MSKSSNHAKAPICAAFVNSLREVFGEKEVIVLYVKEGEVEIGNVPQLAADTETATR